jgi:hypothetical protein
LVTAEQISLVSIGNCGRDIDQLLLLLAPVVVGDLFDAFHEIGVGHRSAETEHAREHGLGAGLARERLTAARSDMLLSPCRCDSTALVVAPCCTAHFFIGIERTISWVCRITCSVFSAGSAVGCGFSTGTLPPFKPE